jgi:hypothetical protein
MLNVSIEVPLLVKAKLKQRTEIWKDNQTGDNGRGDR